VSRSQIINCFPKKFKRFNVLFTSGFHLGVTLDSGRTTELTPVFRTGDLRGNSSARNLGDAICCGTSVLGLTPSAITPSTFVLDRSCCPFSARPDSFMYCILLADEEAGNECENPRFSGSPILLFPQVAVYATLKHLPSGSNSVGRMPASTHPLCFLSFRPRAVSHAVR